MVQKFMDSIVTEGEWSLIFFGGEFSHAVLKTPSSGDFRVQNDFGGTALASLIRRNAFSTVRPGPALRRSQRLRARRRSSRHAANSA